MKAGLLFAGAAKTQLRVRNGGLNLTDWVAALLVVVLAMNLPTPVFMPVGPTLLLAPLLVLLIWRSFIVWAPRLLTEPAIWLVCLIWLASGAADGLGESSGAVINYVGRAVGEALAFGSLIVYAVSRPSRMIWLWRAFVAFLVGSLLWYALEVLEGDPFQTWRLILFAGRDEVQWNNTYRYYGLATSLAVYGYQLSALLPITVGLSLYAARPWVRGIFLGFAALTMILVEYSTQRSALLGGAVGIGLLVLFYKQPGSSRRSLLLYASILAGLVVLVFNRGILDAPYQASVVSQKLITSDDVSWRLGMQVAAINMLVRYPAGTLASGVTWEEEGLTDVRERYAELGAANAVAVHNGYLTRSVRFGLLYFIAAVWFLGRVAWLCWQIWRRPLVWPDPLRLPLALTIAATVSTVYVQAMFHNASVVTGDGVSMILIVLVVAGYFLTVCVNRAGTRGGRRPLSMRKQANEWD